ncbi:MAG: class I SAM-dependent methyltransferase [Chloroflexota bacterium]|nr:class I SAM-dependent methyltransferase [Chloroflexota bacterium]
MTDTMLTHHEYTIGYDPDFVRLLMLRNAETHAAYLLPSLTPGLRLLDFGCGPGTITLGLAARVEPGEVHAVDIEESQIEMARAAAVAGGHDNISFQVGNVCELPFEDGYFDVAHCHTVLCHVPDTQAALREVKRVLKPGGLVASREAIIDSCFIEPAGEQRREYWATIGGLIAANGGHPQMGRELKRELLKAGFIDISTSASFEYFGTEKEKAALQTATNGWFFTPRVMATATECGLATAAQFEQWRRDNDLWKSAPGGVGGFAFGEATAKRP